MLVRAGLPLAVLALTALSAAMPASAALVDVVNGIRMQGCGGQPAAGEAVRGDPALDTAARAWSRGSSLEAALERNGYPAARSTSIEIAGTRDEAAIREFLAAGYCDAVNDPALAAAGEYRRGNRSWLVLVESASTEALADEQAVAERVLALVNAARAEARLCGRSRYAAAGPLTLSAPLSSAAAAHAADMARRGSIGHTGSDGSEAGDRVTRTRYAWRAVGENVAAGQRTPATVVADWLASPTHCANIMTPQFTEMGIAFAFGSRSRSGVYWAQVLAAPR